MATNMMRQTITTVMTSHGPFGILLQLCILVVPVPAVSDVDPVGRTALTIVTTDRPSRFPRNQILVHIGDSVLPALVDIGSSISVLSRLRKGTPPEGPVLNSAFDTISSPIVSEISRFF